MKKLIIGLFLMLPLFVFAQTVKPDFVRSPNSGNTMVDWNVKFKTMILPHYNLTHKPSSQDTIGAMFLNTDTTDHHVYIRYKMGAGGIIPMANVSDVGLSATYVHKADSANLPGYVTRVAFIDTLKNQVTQLDPRYFKEPSPHFITLSIGDTVAADNNNFAVFMSPSGKLVTPNINYSRSAQTVLYNGIKVQSNVAPTIGTDMMRFGDSLKWSSRVDTSAFIRKIPTTSTPQTGDFNLAGTGKMDEAVVNSDLVVGDPSGGGTGVLPLAINMGGTSVLQGTFITPGDFLLTNQFSGNAYNYEQTIGNSEVSIYSSKSTDTTVSLPIKFHNQTQVLLTPVSGHDIANKAYVDGISAGGTPNPLIQDYGIATFSYNGGTAGVKVKVDTTTIMPKANSYTLAGMQTKLNNYRLKTDSSTFDYGLNKTAHSVKVDTTTIKSKAGFLTDYNNLSGRITTNTTAISTEASRATAAEATKTDKLGIYGAIYNKSTFSSLSDFNTNGATASTSGGQIVLTGSTADYTHSLDLKGNTLLDQWSMTVDVVAPTATSTSAIAIGVRSSNSISTNFYGKMANLDLTNTGTAGTLTLLGGISGGTLQGTSANKLTFTAGDIIEISMSRSGINWTIRAVNKTSPQGDVSVTFANNGTSVNSVSGTQNTGTFSLFAKYSTAINVTAVSVFSNCPTGADATFQGDSKIAGGMVTAYANTMTSILSRYYSVINQGGGSDGVNEVISRLPEVIALHPKTAFMCIGRNDIQAGTSLSVIEAKVITIDSTLTAAGIKVIWFNNFYETTINQDTYSAWILTQFPTRSIDSYSATKASSAYLYSDGVHLTDAGHSLIAKLAIQSGFLPAIKSKFTVSNDDIINAQLIPAHTFVANNTASDGINNQGNIFNNPGQETYSGTPTWTAGTAPSGTMTGTYNFTQIGKLVIFRLNIIYVTAGATCTEVTLPLPSDMPTPETPTGFTTSNSTSVFLNGSFGTATNATPSASNRVLLRNNSGWVFDVAGASNSAKAVWVSGYYFAQ